MASPHLFVNLLTILIASFSIEVSATVGGRKLIAGFWQPIKDPQDKYILEIGEFAVTEHNKESGSVLDFTTVIKGDQQVVQGMNYKLYLTAKDQTDGDLTHQYLAVVYDMPFGEKTRKLDSFEKVGY